MATKIIKNQGYILLLWQKNIARYISAQQQNYILRNDANMYIRLIRNEAKGNAITGRLVIDGRWFCNTLERKGYEILALCYHVCVTQSPKFKRLLPLVCGVPSSVESCRIVEDSVESSSAEKTMLNHSTQPPHKATPCAMRSGIRFHRGSKPEHSTGCILVVGDKDLKTTQTTIPLANIASGTDNTLFGKRNVGARSSCPSCLPKTTSSVVVGSRTAANVEQELTQLLLKSQNEHEEIILEVTDYKPGTEYGYNHPCERELQKR